MKTTRRNFLTTILLSAIAGKSLTSRGQQPTRNRYSEQLEKFKEHIKNLPRKSGLKIQKIETFCVNQNLCFVRVKANDGSEGIGQVSPFDADITATVLHRKIAPLALGEDPYDFDAISDKCVERNYKFPWSFVCRALAGVDTALWDLRGKRENKTVCELLGGKPRKLPVYGSSMSRTIKPEEEAQRMLRLRETKGFNAFKLRVGKVCGHDEDEWAGRTEALIPTVRKALGDKVALLADANSCYSPKKAIEVGRLLEQHNYCHFEEPCPYWELEWTAEVAAALNIAVAGGEQDNDLAQWRRMIRMNAVDIVQPDLCYIGGLTRGMRVAIMGAEAGKPCVPHSANRSMVILFTLHLCGAIPNFGDHIEFTIEQDKWTENIYSPMPEVEDGIVKIPDSEPGWGVKVNSDLLAKADYKVTAKS